MKMCEVDSQDHEAVAKLFNINDSIHRTLQRYRLMVKGDVDGASRIPKGTLGTSGAGVSKGPDNELSLIDLGGSEDGDAGPASNGQSVEPATAGQESLLENDLIGLSMGGDDDNSQSLGGQISLGGPTMLQPASTASTAALPPELQAKIHPRQPQPPQTAPIYGAFHTAASPQPQVQSPQPPLYTPQPQQPQHQKPSAPDPFAALSPSSSNTPRGGSPFQHAQANGPPSAFQPPPAYQQKSPAPTSVDSAAGANANGNGTKPLQKVSNDDDWTFASALPDQSHEVTVLNSSIHVSFLVSRPDGPGGQILLKSRISNNTTNRITDLTFQAAVMKVRHSLSYAPRRTNLGTRILSPFALQTIQHSHHPRA